MIPFYCTTKNIDETDNSAQFLIDTTTYKTVKIGTVSGFTYNYIVNWGDGTSTAHTTSAVPSHTYSTDGDKTITITGRFPAISYGIYGNTTSEPVLKEILSCKLVFTGTGLTDGFNGCTLLTTIPHDMFYCSPSVTTFYNIFYGCAALTEIPEHLFDKNTQVTVDAFYSTFSGCTGLTAIPTDLFKYNTQVSTNGFRSTFYQNAYITSIPEDLFKYSQRVATGKYYQTFMECTGLTTMPTTIDFLGADPGSTTSVTRMFYSCSGITGALAEFWNLYDTTSWTKTGCYSGCINATNFAAAQAAGFAA